MARVTLPIDHLEALWPQDLHGMSIGALLHPASVNAKLKHSSEILKERSGTSFHLKAFFGPQHGFLGETQDNMIEWQGFEHPRFKVPVYSLYGEHREPSQKMLEGLDALLVDLQDVGARYYTFIWSLYLSMKACEKAGKPIVVCERPNPITGQYIEGPKLNPSYTSFVGMHPIPIRHGETIGQLARRFQAEAFPKCQLYVLEMEGWHRGLWYDETGLPWVMPSPNMPTLETAIVYPGMCLFEATNVSEGRGTTRPFELFGAPWIDAHGLLKKMESQNLPGLKFREAYFQPTFQKYRGQICNGLQIHVEDRDNFKPVETAMRILKVLIEEYPQHFRWKAPPYEYETIKLPIEILLGNDLDLFFPGTKNWIQAINPLE